MEIIKFLDQHNGFIMAILTFVYVVFTIFIFIANSRSVKEMKLSREEENRPYIISYFYLKPKGTAELIIENIGKSIARNVSIKIFPEFKFPKNCPLSDSYILNKPIPSMPPNYKIKAFVGMTWDFKQKDGSFPIYNIEINYNNTSGKLYRDYYIIDLNIENTGITYVIEKDLHDLTKEFIEFRKKFDRLQRDVSYIINTNIKAEIEHKAIEE